MTGRGQVIVGGLLVGRGAAPAGKLMAAAIKLTQSPSRLPKVRLNELVPRWRNEVMSKVLMSQRQPLPVGPMFLEGTEFPQKTFGPGARIWPFSIRASSSCAGVKSWPSDTCIWSKALPPLYLMPFNSTFQLGASKE